MSYLRFIQYKMQTLAETVALALNVEVAIADKNLIRIVGTGGFYSKIDDVCADDSLFAKVLKTGQPIINLYREEECKDCSNKIGCREYANMIYPIKDRDKIIGVLCFASFDKFQADMMRVKQEEYYNMLKETALIVEREIKRVNVTNKLKKNTTEVNEIINRLSEGIIILNSDSEIIHINSKALKILNINISNEKILEKKIDKFIKNIKLIDSGSQEVVDLWSVNGKDMRVLYTINKIMLKDDEFSIMISFDSISDIINIAKTYENKEKIYFRDIIGTSRPILKAINKAKTVASYDSTILIQGASGTGKELFAKSIHNESPRSDGPFVAINCSSIPENLIESELFGYEKGAFTGASNSGKKGKIELANNGTLFLDEIGDLPIFLQTKLLRVLQERTIDRLGGEKPIHVNIRIISATNKDLKELVEKNEFRLDLYYRLNVIPINLPSLKERERDVIVISNYILDKLCQKMNKEKMYLSKEVEEIFYKYPFPGNIRELENILEHGVCFSKDKFIKLEDLPEYIQEEKEEEIKEVNIEKLKGKSLEKMTGEFEKTIIDNFLKAYGNTVEGKKQIAEKLDIGLTTLYRKINEA